MEDPVQEFGDFLNHYNSFMDVNSYGYVFSGQTGTLDYGFLSPLASGNITGASYWNVNADVPDLFDYTLRYGRDESLFDASSPLRFSDHDPFLITLDFCKDGIATFEPKLYMTCEWVAKSPRKRCNKETLKTIDGLTPKDVCKATCQTCTPCKDERTFSFINKRGETKERKCVYMDHRKCEKAKFKNVAQNACKETCGTCW